MNITPSGGVTGPQPIQPNSSAPVRKVYGADPTQRTADSAQISLQARLLKKLHELPDVRTGKVDRVAQEIAAGTYESQEKLQQAVNKLLEDLR